MEWYVIVILVIAIPIILFPAAYVWYINFGGLVAMYKKAREKQAEYKGNKSREELEYEKALTETMQKYPW